MYFSAQVIWGPCGNKGNLIGNLRYFRTHSKVWRQYSYYKFKMLVYGVVGLTKSTDLKSKLTFFWGVCTMDCNV